MTFNIDVGYRSDMQTIKFDRTVRNPMTAGGGRGACLIGEIYTTVMVERTKAQRISLHTVFHKGEMKINRLY